VQPLLKLEAKEVRILASKVDKVQDQLLKELILQVRRTEVVVLPKDKVL
jgi:hypothetical protein